MKLYPIYIIVILLVLLTGCAKPPAEEMADAREAVFRAENDPGAVQFAGNVLERARNSLQRMQEEADNKRYDAAKEHAAEAIALAERAIADGRIGASRANIDPSDIAANLRSEIEEIQRSINGARYSNLPLDYDLLEREIINAFEALDRVEARQAEGRNQEALDIARGLRAELSNINDRVARAVVPGKK